jgi:hypothetical protein
MTQTTLLTEEQAIELFTFLITAARTQLDDPCSYASMRLLTAAEKLREFIRPGLSPEAQQLLDSTVEKTEHAQIIMNDSERYTAALDELCELVARHLVARSELAGGSAP